MSNNTIETLDRIIKEAQARADLFQTNIDKLQYDIDMYVTLKDVLDENLSVLKQSDTIASIPEYKKANIEKQAVTKRLSELYEAKNMFIGSLSAVVLVMEKALSQYADAVKIQEAGNVIYVNFKRE